jgi:tetratricopeptide (TPR) repeat protein
LRIRSRELWICLALLVAVAVVYSDVRRHDFIHYDDPVYITDNPHIRGGFSVDGFKYAFTSIETGHWMPLTWISHMIDCDTYGLDAGWHHLVSVFLHGLSTVALFLLLLKLTGAEWPSAFVAAVFGLHPLHVESVAWAAERKDVLSVFFSILTLWAYANYAKSPSAKRYAWVTGFFVCGLMSKSMLVTLPLVMLLLDYWPLRRKMNRNVIVEKIPLLALSIGASIVTFIAQRKSGAVSAIDQVSIPLRIENVLVSYVSYLGHFFWPAKLSVVYPFPDAIPAWQWIGAGALLAAISAAVYFSKRPFLATGWLWYLGTLVPVIGLVQVGAQSRTDHFTYLPSIGISIMVAFLAADLAWARYGAMALGCAWVAMTWSYVPMWRDSVTLFSHALQVTDRNWIAHNNLGGTLRRRGDLKGAIVNFEKTVELRPGFPDLQDNLGEALTSAGRAEDALPHFAEALRIRPGFAKAHVDFGTALVKLDRANEAIPHFVEALKLDPNYGEAYFRLAGILASQGRTDEATPLFKAAIPYLNQMAQLNPNDPEAHHNLGGVYGMMGQMDEAIGEFQKVVTLRPLDAEAHYNLGIAYGGRGGADQALAEFDRAIRLKPDYVFAHYQMGKVLAAVGRKDEARQEFSQALRFGPDFEPARKALADIAR